MEEFEEEVKTCNCCSDCNCGDDCHCTEDNKCCDNCTCGEGKCDCDKSGDCECKCDCDKSCDCEDKCDCSEDNDTDCNNGDDVEADEISDENDAELEVEEDVQDVLDDKECKCGCGEKLDESTADAYFKQLLSLRAEFDNYRKRTQNDIAKAYSNGFNQAITEFLPALDSFKMATEYITDPNTLMGIQYIEKGILNTLEKIGVNVIDVSGKFDPNFHQAIGSEVSAEHESGDIIKECFKGFTMGDKVIRYSQVIVCK